MDLRVDITLKAEALSRPEVGSSRSKTAGSWRRLRPIETRRRSPPERSEIRRVLATWVRRRSARRESTVAWIWDLLGRRRRAAKANVSETVKRGRQASC